MNGRDFYDQIQAHERFEWLGADEGAPDTGGVALISDKETGLKYIMAVLSILKESWKDLEAVLLGRREGKIMVHLTRIVGYYSRVQNWNKSKLAELADRHKGKYSCFDSYEKTNIRVLIATSCCNGRRYLVTYLADAPYVLHTGGKHMQCPTCSEGALVEDAIDLGTIEATGGNEAIEKMLPKELWCRSCGLVLREGESHGDGTGTPCHISQERRSA